MLKKRLVVSFFFLFFFLIFNSSVFARSGCCSHHGGVCGCGCCDGTSLSATCAPYYPSCGGGYETTNYISKRTIPTNTSASWNYFINSEGGVDMMIDWDRPDKKLYSIVLSKYAGGDPGPNADTNESEYVFKNVKPGKWYINIKEEFDGYWSEVAYWTADIPNNVKETAIPYPTPTLIPTKKVSPATKSTSSEDSSNSLQTIAMVALGGGIYHYFNKIKRK